MMNFEDVVNMDWVSNEEVLTPDYSSFFVDQQNNFILDQPLPPLPSQEQQQQQEPVKGEITMHTLEQIKQLIELAKQQLAAREQEIQTAAPSVIFAPPAENKESNENNNENNNENTAMDTSMKDEDAIQDYKQFEEEYDLIKKGDKHNEETITTLEAYAAADGIDLKKLTSKERRQLRNKISARNFRVRRKEYITSLEEQVAEHKKTAEELKEKLTKVEEENKTLKKEMDVLKRQNQQLLSMQQQPSSPRVSASLPKPNINKDISLLGTKPTESYRHQQDHHCILVSNAVMPVWDYKTILQDAKKHKESALFRELAGHFLLFVVQIATSLQPKSYMPDELQFSPKTKSSSYMEYLYDTLIQASLVNSSTVDKSFLWSDSPFVI
ncbi:hypothetical protein RMCBS344292_08564 [Rhizopus microsporus]|nr:hypothetical protein RMCBS344292_08564 [Rhizopus microsporus]